MSWSIWLSGSKEFVRGELEDAISTLRQAAEVLERVERPTVSVQANGHGYSESVGECSFSGSFTVGGSFPAIPAPPSAPTNEAAPLSPDVAF